MKTDGPTTAQAVHLLLFWFSVFASTKTMLLIKIWVAKSIDESNKVKSPPYEILNE